MAYTFDAIFAVDPHNPANIAKNAAITIFDPADVAQSPITIQDPTGSPLPNPITVDAAGMSSAFQHPTLARVGWKGAGFTGYFTSYEGMLAEAVAAKAAAESASASAAAAAVDGVSSVVANAEAAVMSAANAATSASTAAASAAASAALVGAPADAAIAAAINGNGTATKAALANTIAATAIGSTSQVGMVDLAAMGDSITAAKQTDPVEGQAISWASLVSEWAGIGVFNPSVPGERQGDIATRYGTPIQFTVPGGVIPAAATEFTVTLVLPAATNFIGSTDAGPQSNFNGTFLGVPVSVRFNKTEWFMKRREAATASKPVPATGGTFRVDSARGVQNAILVSFGGRNGSTASLTSQTREMLKRMPEPRRALLIPPVFANPVTTNEDGLASLAAEFGEGVIYYNPRSYLVTRGLDDEGVPHTAQDDVDIAAGKIPGSFYLDGIHPTAAGHRALARVILERLVDVGWIDANSVSIPPRAIPLPPSGPTKLYLPAGTTGEAFIASSPELVNAQQLEIMMHVEPVNMTSQVVLSRSGLSPEGVTDSAFAVQTLSSGAVRTQFFNTITPGGAAVNSDSDTFTWPTGAFSIRGLVNASIREVKWYIGPDSSNFDAATWTQIGVTKTGTATSIYPKNVPLRLRLDGYWKRIVVKTGTTVLVDQNFTDPANTYDAWTFLGGAEIVNA